MPPGWHVLTLTGLEVALWVSGYHPDRRVHPRAVWASNRDGPQARGREHPTAAPTATR